MAKMIAISDDLAALLETRRARAGYASIEAAAEAAIVRGLESAGVEDDDALPFSDHELKAMLAVADASGPLEVWDAAVRSEVVARHRARARDE